MKEKKPSLPYHELFPLNEGESTEEFSPLPPDQIRILVRRYEPTGIKRAQRLYSGVELKDMMAIGKRWGRGLYELEARTIDGRFYRRVSYDIDGDAPKPLDPPTELAQQAAANAGDPSKPMGMTIPQGSMGGGLGEMMMVMMQNMFSMMMAQQSNSTQLLAAVLGKNSPQTDPAIAAVIASLTELSKTRLEIDAGRTAPAMQWTPEQQIAQMNAFIDFAKKLNPTAPAETLTQQIKELWPMFQPTLAPIVQKIVEAGASAAARGANGVPQAAAAAVPLPSPTAPAG